MRQGHFGKAGLEGWTLSMIQSEPQPGRGILLGSWCFGKIGLRDLSEFFCALLKVLRASQLCFPAWCCQGGVSPR